jgi:hypothetical protein
MVTRYTGWVGLSLGLFMIAAAVWLGYYRWLFGTAVSLTFIGYCLIKTANEVVRYKALADSMRRATRATEELLERTSEEARVLKTALDLSNRRNDAISFELSKLIKDKEDTSETPSRRFNDVMLDDLLGLDADMAGSGGRRTSDLINRVARKEDKS